MAGPDLEIHFPKAFGSPMTVWLDKLRSLVAMISPLRLGCVLCDKDSKLGKSSHARASGLEGQCSSELTISTTF
jgi:hypothetical protein